MYMYMFLYMYLSKFVDVDVDVCVQLSGLVSSCLVLCDSGRMFRVSLSR